MPNLREQNGKRTCMTTLTPTFKRVKNTALELLSRRDYSEKELSDKLKIKECPTDEVCKVIHELVQAGYINEAKITENHIHWRRVKGLGPERIAMELKARGIPEAIIAEQLDMTDNAWLAEAQKVWQKHFKNQMPSDFKTKAKQMRFLQYRGFTSEQIESVFNESFETA